MTNEWPDGAVARARADDMTGDGGWKYLMDGDAIQLKHDGPVAVEVEVREHD